MEYRIWKSYTMRRRSPVCSATGGSGQSFITWPYCQPFSGKGIGKELGWRCIACFPDSEWFLETETAIDFIRN